VWVVPTPTQRPFRSRSRCRPDAVEATSYFGYNLRLRPRRRFPGVRSTPTDDRGRPSSRGVTSADRGSTPHGGVATPPLAPSVSRPSVTATVEPGRYFAWIRVTSPGGGLPSPGRSAAPDRTSPRRSPGRSFVPAAVEAGRSFAHRAPDPPVRTPRPFPGRTRVPVVVEPGRYFATSASGPGSNPGGGSSALV
jgi:hypothetical protein